MVDRPYPMPEDLIRTWGTNIVARLPQDEEERFDYVSHTLEGVREGAINLLKIIPSYNKRGRYCAACLADACTSVRFHIESGEYLDYNVGPLETGLPRIAPGFSQKELIRARTVECSLEWVLLAGFYMKAAILVLFKDDGEAVDNILNDYMCVLEDTRVMCLALAHKPNKVALQSQCVEFETMD